MKQILFVAFIFLLCSTITIAEVNADIFSDDSSVDINEVDSFTNIVIFIKFNDEIDYTAPYDYEHYEEMFNGEDMVSLRDYYLEVSYNKLTIDSYLVNENSEIIYYVDSHDRSYYEPFDSIENPDGYKDGSRDDREHELLKDAIDFVDDNNLIDDSIVLDSNDDGIIDSITFMVSGEDSGWRSTLWPHQWSLHSYYLSYSEMFTADAPVINGVNAYEYTIELMGNQRDYLSIINVGVLAHETFHLISAPDLYHYYNSQNIDPVGDWGIMGESADIPSHMLGYMKAQYGNWIDDVTEITESGSYTLEPLQNSENNLYKIDLGYSNEYIYLEYRDNLGLYENGLDDTGLLVYRVDLDYYDLGNVDGYYDDQDQGIDEVFIFRPGITNIEPPITFPELDEEFNDEDGLIGSAALSQYNLFDEMGMGTDIPMFYSNGELIDITINNVVQNESSISFDIELPIRIEIDIDEEIPAGTTLLLVDDLLYEYNVSFVSLPKTGEVYYTLDGSLPTTNDTQYDGGLITIDASQNVVTVAVYDGEEFIESTSKEFNFVSTIETEHNPYQNLKDVTWYLDFKIETLEYILTFDDSSELEEDYDYLYITDNGNTVLYTGIEMRNEEISSLNGNILINFVSNDYISFYYGIEIDVVANDDMVVHLKGNDYIEVYTDSIYVEEGTYITGFDIELYSVSVDGTIDMSIPGLQVLTYNLVDQDNVIVDSIIREVLIIDVVAPIISLVGDEEINTNFSETYTELGVTYIDNLGEDLTYSVSGTVNTDILGEYILVYTVTDSSGNISNEVTRTVNVVDNAGPVLELLPHLDTIFIGDEYLIPEISVYDNHTIELTVEVNVYVKTSVGEYIIGNIDTSVEGEYIIEYTSTDLSGNTSSIKRYVNVIPREILKEFVCEAGKSTFNIDDEITPPKCYVDGILAEVQVPAVTSVYFMGTHEITYTVTIDNIVYEKISYVFIYDQGEKLVSYYDRKRGYSL
jgi:M6 family metalloprotease-like protein